MRQIEHKLYEWLGSEWAGGVTPPMNQTSYTTDTKQFDEHYRISNDGFELWIGSDTKWYWHTNRRGARQLWWFITMWFVGEWFGLRRVLWYWLLHRRVARHKAWMGKQ